MAASTSTERTAPRSGHPAHRPPPWSPWREANAPAPAPLARHSDAVVLVVKTVHTLAWFSIESCMVYLLYAGFAGRSDRKAGVAAAVVGGETLIFAANGFRCPLTQLAQRYGAERGAVTDIWLPKWFAHNLPAIHTPLLVLAVYLHGRNLRRARRRGDRCHDLPGAGSRPPGSVAHVTTESEGGRR